MVLSARIVKNAKRRVYWCADCERPISGTVIKVYGMAETGEKPYPLHFHPRCNQYVKDEKVVRARRAAAYLSEHPEATIKAAFAATKD